MNSILEEITPIFRDLFVDDELVLTPEMTADDVDGWDSLSHTRLILAIESHYGVKMPMERVMNLENLGDLADLIAGCRTTI